MICKVVLEMIRKNVFDCIVGILIVVGLLLAWNFPNPLGEHDVFKSKIGFNASFEFDFLVFMMVFFVISLVCRYYHFLRLFVDIGNVVVLASSVLVLMVATESLYLTCDSNFSDKIFRKFDNDTDREAQMMFWISLLLFSFTSVRMSVFSPVTTNTLATMSTGPPKSKSLSHMLYF